MAAGSIDRTVRQGISRVSGGTGGHVAGETVGGIGQDGEVAGNAAAAGQPLTGFTPSHPGVVRGCLRRAHACPGRGVGVDLRRPQRAGRRADRLRQDAGGVPVGAGPACSDSAARPTRSTAAGCSTSRRSRRWPSTWSATCVPRSPGIGADRRPAGARGPRHLRRRPVRRHPPADRRKLGTTPPDILITTPESLFLMLTSQASEALRGVETVILDEVHAVAGTKRGAHLALSLERLDELLGAGPAQRIGLSATVRPIEEVARFLGGAHPVEVVAPKSSQAVGPAGRRAGRGHDRAGARRGPEDLEGPAAGSADRAASIWPHVEERIVDLVEQHRSTIVFANSRRLAERLTARLNEIAVERAGEAVDVPIPTRARPRSWPRAGPASGADGVIARAHHGSVSKEQRALIEDDLKAGRLPCVVATSSLELGIDMGAVDLVIQVESPPSVASGLQRVGRAGHQVGEVSRGVLLPKHRADLVQTAVAVERMRSGADRGAEGPGQPARRARPADRRGHVGRWSGTSTSCSTSYAGPRRSRRCPDRRTTRRSTCCRAATRPTSSPSSDPGSSGTGSPTP